MNGEDLFKIITIFGLIIGGIGGGFKFVLSRITNVGKDLHERIDKVKDTHVRRDDFDKYTKHVDQQFRRIEDNQHQNIQALMSSLDRLHTRIDTIHNEIKKPSN